MTGITTPVKGFVRESAHAASVSNMVSSSKETIQRSKTGYLPIARPAADETVVRDS